METPLWIRSFPATPCSSLSTGSSNSSNSSNTRIEENKNNNKNRDNNRKSYKNNKKSKDRKNTKEQEVVGVPVGNCNRGRRQTTDDKLVDELLHTIQEYQGYSDAIREREQQRENDSVVVAAVQPDKVKYTTQLEPEWSSFLAEVEAHEVSGSNVPVIKMIPRIFNKLAITHNIENRRRALAIITPYTRKNITFVIKDKTYSWLKLALINTAVFLPLLMAPPRYNIVLSTMVFTFLPVNVWYVQQRYNRRRFQDITIDKVDQIIDYCPHSHVSNNIHTKATIEVVKGARMQCEPRGYPLGFTIAKYALWIPRLCHHSELVALTRRQCLPEISDARTRAAMWTKAVEILPTCFRNICPSEMPDFYSWVKGRYGARETERLTKTYEDYMKINAVDQIEDPFYYNKGFVKREKLCSRVEKRFPRFISSTPELYKVLTAPGCTVLFDAIKNIDWRESGLFIAAGLNGVEIGGFCTLMENLGFDAYPGDYSKYDGHIELEALKAEITSYKRMGAWSELLRLLRFQQFTRGRTKNYKFHFKGKRGSGVGNTSLGNCILNYLITLVTCNHLKPGSDWVTMVNGDDFILFLKPHLSLVVINLVKNAELMGHSLTMETESVAYDKLEFCSQYFWNVGTPEAPNRILGPKPFRTLAKTFTPCDEISHDLLRPWIREVLVGYKAYSFIPVLGQIVTKTLDKVQYRDYKALPEYLLVKMRKEQAYKIGLEFLDVETIDYGTLNDQFYFIYGYPVTALQELIEVDFSETGLIISGDLLDHCLLIDGVDNSYNNESLYSGSTKTIDSRRTTPEEQFIY